MQPLPAKPSRGGDWETFGDALHANVSELVTAWPAVQAASGDASVLSTTSTRERPTNDPNVVVIWHTPTPPTDLMLARDIWEPTGL